MFQSPERLVHSRHPPRAAAGTEPCWGGIHAYGRGDGLAGRFRAGRADERQLIYYVGGGNSYLHKPSLSRAYDFRIRARAFVVLHAESRYRREWILGGSGVRRRHDRAWPAGR